MFYVRAHRTTHETHTKKDKVNNTEWVWTKQQEACMYVAENEGDAHLQLQPHLLLLCTLLQSQTGKRGAAWLPLHVEAGQALCLWDLVCLQKGVKHEANPSMW